MKILQVTSLGALAHGVLGVTAIQSRDYDVSTAEHEVQQLVAAIGEKASAELSSHDSSSGCTAKNIIYRRELYVHRIPPPPPPPTFIYNRITTTEATTDDD